MQANRDLGAWILPQPIEENVWIPIPRFLRSSAVPFGYTLDNPDDDFFQPVPLELEALEQAKKYLKQYSSRLVANWLVKQTGRYISHVGLLKRIKSEQSRKRKATTYRNLARRLEKAIKAAQSYEQKLQRTEQSKFFEKDYYTSLIEAAAKFNNRDNDTL